MFGEKDEFLSIFNPLYFIETLGNDGQTLLQRNLPLIDHKAVLERLTEPEQALLENVSLLSPETFLKTIREEIRDLDVGKLVLEGQKVQLIQQQRENKEAVAQGKERMAQIKTQIDALEQKREVGIDRPALEKQLEGLHLRYEELLRDKARYRMEIIRMKELIQQITDKIVTLNAGNMRNKMLAENQFSRKRAAIGAGASRNKAARNYYNNMNRLNYVSPQFYDNKK